MKTLTVGNVAQIDDVTIVSVISMTCWRREWDSNPRYSFPHTRFPSVRLKPQQAAGDITIDRGAGVLDPNVRDRAGTAGPALAQACTREGDAVSCDDGRRGLPSDDAIGPTARDRACRRIRASSSAINRR
jgi:hypothetical protein